MTLFILAPLSGALVGLILGMIGGGGSILAVPLLIYVVGVSSTHVALGTSAVAVALSAAANLIPHWKAGHIKWRCAGVFTIAGIVGAFLGSSLAKMTNGDLLLLAFGILMLVVGAMMLLKRSSMGNPEVRLSKASASHLVPRLTVSGLAVGALSGFFGIGGGFLIVPGLMLATGMPLIFAIGTSLVAVTAFGLTTAFNYAISGLVDWQLAGLFVVGGVGGGVLGTWASRHLSKKGNALHHIFAAVVVIIGFWIVWQGIGKISA